MVSATPSTPSPPPSIRTPPAPRLGYYDSWEPYSPRKSARISAQRTSARTPSPGATDRQQPSSPRTAKKSINQLPAAMASPASSPRKKRQAAPDSVRRAPADFSAESSAMGAAALGRSDKMTQKPVSAFISRATGMLPTPSKTPQKPPNEKTVAQIQSFARNLFPSEETPLSTPRKRRAKKYTGMTMESFRAEETDASIEIFTDSRDRIPKKDDDTSNPFMDSEQPEASKRRSRRRQIHIPGEGLQPIEEASQREDGMVYVFRGKKMFMKFSDIDAAQEEELAEAGADLEAHLGRPLTRSSIKPRLLFPTKKPEILIEDEEAVTDVEDLQMSEHEEVPQTPTRVRQEVAKTPDAPKFAPVSPPDTKRTTRSTNKLADMTPLKRTSRKSPFDSWPRTKEHKSLAGSKRPAESLASPDAKRTRA